MPKNEFRLGSIPTPPGLPPGPSGNGFWPGYLRGGYFDDCGALRVEYIDREHMEPLARAMAGGKLSSTQVRRFFSHCRAIEGKLKAFGTDKWAVEYSKFKGLDVFASDALAKQKIPQLFHDFLRDNVLAVRTADDFLRGFMPHFEALVGFGTAHFAKSERN
jgi:hypothetical protein